jgi:hypothetical protein
MPIWGGNKHLCLIWWLTLDTQNRCSGGEPLLNWAIIWALSTINAMQEDYASNRRLNMMHVDHAMPIWGVNKHLCLIRWLTLDTQSRCSGGEPLLDWGFYLILITFNAVYRSFEMNVSLCLIFIGALMFVWDKVQNCCFVCLLYSLVWDWLVAACLLCYIEPLLHCDISLQTCAGLFT